MFHLVGSDTATRRMPTSEHHFPWKLVALVAVTMLIATLATAGVFSGNTPTSTVQLERQEEQTVLQPAELSEPVALAPDVPAIPLITVAWTKIVSADIPQEKLTLVSGDQAQSELNFPFSAWGHGDGTAFLLERFVSYNEGNKLFFTPNQGVNWYEISNLYPEESVGTPAVIGATLEGDTIFLYMSLEPAPWVSSPWRGEVKLSKLQ